MRTEWMYGQNSFVVFVLHNKTNKKIPSLLQFRSHDMNLYKLQFWMNTFKIFEVGMGKTLAATHQIVNGSNIGVTQGHKGQIWITL